MAMTGPGMAADVIAAIESIRNSNPTPQDAHEAYWVAICTAIVEYIQTNAVVIQPVDSAGDTEAPGTVT